MVLLSIACGCCTELVLQPYGQGYGQMQYPYGQAQYGQQQQQQDASMTGQPQQGQPGAGAAPYGAQQQMPYGQMREFFFHSLLFTSEYEALSIMCA